MKKTVFVLLHDYWHPRNTIEPLLKELFPADKYFLTVTEDPNYPTAYFKAPDLLVNFKDGIANTSIPTTNWYNDNWSFMAPMAIAQQGMGYLAVHCGTANVPQDHPMFTKVLRARFLNHPPICPVTFEPKVQHPILDGVESFTTDDEHYIIDLAPEEKTCILATSTSQHGQQPALWAHEMGKGRVCGVTPGHRENTLLHPMYVKLLKNAVEWCIRKD